MTAEINNQTTNQSTSKTAVSEKANISGVILNPSLNAAVLIGQSSKSIYGEETINNLTETLDKIVNKVVKEHDLSHCEEMLIGQAEALQSIFTALSRKALNQQYLKDYEVFLRLALKAQSQCRATIETLATLKNPPVVFAKQANIAQGHQQINNGTGLHNDTSQIGSSNFNPYARVRVGE